MTARNRNRRGMMLLLGAAAGAAAGFFLNSDQGRRVRQDAGTQINHLGREVGTRTRRGFDSLSTNVNSLIERGRSMITGRRSRNNDYLSSGQSGSDYSGMGSDYNTSGATRSQSRGRSQDLSNLEG